MLYSACILYSFDTWIIYVCACTRFSITPNARQWLTLRQRPCSFVGELATIALFSSFDFFRRHKDEEYGSVHSPHHFHSSLHGKFEPRILGKKIWSTYQNNTPRSFADKGRSPPRCDWNSTFTASYHNQCHCGRSEVQSSERGWYVFSCV